MNQHFNITTPTGAVLLNLSNYWVQNGKQINNLYVEIPKTSTKKVDSSNPVAGPDEPRGKRVETP